VAQGSEVDPAALMTANDLSSFAGLTAMVLLTVNLLLGLLVSTNYNPARDWPRRKLPVPLWRIHNWNAYLAISVALLHPTLLLFVSNPRFHIGDILLPVSSPGQTLFNNLGALTLYSFLFVVVTSYFRPQLRYRRWKKLHYTAYFAAIVMYIHGTLIDQNLKNQTPDFFDGEKVLVEGCGLLVLAATIWRIRRGTEKQRYAAAQQMSSRRY
jgi:methionine sulfoxide reductase heme-binding subunit